MDFVEAISAMVASDPPAPRDGCQLPGDVQSRVEISTFNLSQHGSRVFTSVNSRPSFFARLVLWLLILAALGLAVVILVPVGLIVVLVTLLFAGFRALARLAMRAMKMDGQGRRNVRVIERDPMQ